jgi:uncharacterized damage-inducible protein DinB
MTQPTLVPDAAADPQAYLRTLLDLLGDRDPLAVMEELPGWVEERVRGLDDATLRRSEAPGKWSVLHVVQHLADVEVIYRYRTGVVLERDGAPIVGYDQDDWAREFHYESVRLETALAQLRAVRAANLALWRSLTPAQLARAGMHSERGRETLPQMLRLLGGHDLVHRRQIDRILAAVRR